MERTLPVLALIGFAFLLVGGIGLLIAAFRVSILWGIGCLILPIIQLVFLVAHWHEAKKPFLLQLAGLVIIFIAIVVYGDAHIDQVRP